jgi:uncharacterized protein (UPF0332 family)
MSEETFKQIMDIWVTPEVILRQDAKKIPRPYDLRAAQIIFHADGRKNEIRLNEEVRAIGKVKIKKGALKKKGDPVYAHEIENYESFKLPDNEDPNCGHITIIRFGNQWSLAFDFIYNKGIAAEHIKAAHEFISASKQALVNKHMRVFVDTCFSAAELAAKAILLTTPRPDGNIKMSHGKIHSRYNYEAKLGNVDALHKDAFNSLVELRHTARYLNGTLNIKKSKAESLIKTVESSIAFVDALLHPNRK